MFQINLEMTDSLTNEREKVVKLKGFCHYNFEYSHA